MWINDVDDQFFNSLPQVGLNTSGAPPNADAGLDIDFANKGLLIPRVALTGTTNASPMSAHVAGMMVYNTATTADVTPGFYFDNGTKWVPSIPPVIPPAICYTGMEAPGQLFPLASQDKFSS